MKFIKTDPSTINLINSLSKTLVEIKKTITVNKGSSYFFTNLVGFDSFDIRTVKAVSDTGDPLTLTIYDGTAQTNPVYQSLTQSVVDDIVAVPMKDKSGNKFIYISINNSSVTTFTVTLTIQIVSL